MATRRQRYTARARTIYRTATRTRRYNRGGFGVAINTQLLLGVAASFAPINIPPIAQTAITGVAVAPIRLPGGVKMMAQGFVLGKLIQQFTGNPLAGNTSTTTNGGWY